MEEKMFFQAGDVSVSNARFIVHGQTYAMNGVTSVKTGRKDPSRLGPVLLGLFGVLCFPGQSMTGIVFGIAMIALAIFIWRTQKPELTVILSSSSGEAKALTSKNAEFINGVITALNNSIVYRG